MSNIKTKIKDVSQNIKIQILNTTFGSKKINESVVNNKVVEPTYRKSEVYDCKLKKIYSILYKDNKTSYEPSSQRVCINKELDFSKESLLLQKFKSNFNS